jgi:NADH:ubiquinone oxidoreductase subunit 2 (subunit N)
LIASIYLTISKFGTIIAIALLASISNISSIVTLYLGVINLIIGNIIGLLQIRYQRIITYSSLIQIGYMLLVISSSTGMAITYFEVYSLYTILLLVLFTVPAYNLYNTTGNIGTINK